MTQRLSDIEELCPDGIKASGFGVLALDLSTIVGVTGSEPGMVHIYLYGSPPILVTASCEDQQRNPAEELARAIKGAADKARYARRG